MQPPNTPPPTNPSPPPMTAPPPTPMMGGGASMMPQQPMMAAGGYMPQPAPMGMANGGATASKNPIKNFFGDINLVEAGILAIGVATFLYAIYYYRFQIKMTKNGYADLNARVQKLEISESARAKKESNVNATGKMRKRMLI